MSSMHWNKRKLLQQILRFMVRVVLKKYQPLIVGITGSVGKSSTKEAVALVLGVSYTVRKAEGNYNNEIGIPLTIIGAAAGGSSWLRWMAVFGKWVYIIVFPVRYPEVLVLEMGIDRPGDMAFLLEFVPVKIGIVTHISSSHMAYFGTLANIAREKGRLIAALPAVVQKSPMRCRFILTASPTPSSPSESRPPTLPTPSGSPAASGARRRHARLLCTG